MRRGRTRLSRADIPRALEPQAGLSFLPLLRVLSPRGDKEHNVMRLETVTLRREPLIGSSAAKTRINPLGVVTRRTHTLDSILSR